MDDVDVDYVVDDVNEVDVDVNDIDDDVNEVDIDGAKALVNDNLDSYVDDVNDKVGEVDAYNNDNADDHGLVLQIGQNNKYLQFTPYSIFLICPMN